MKNGKKPTLAQKKVMCFHGLIPDNWLVVRDRGTQLEVVSRQELSRCWMAKVEGKKAVPRTKLIGKECV